MKGYSSQVKRTVRQQIADGKEQRKRLLDAYEAEVIGLHEFVSRRNACDKKIERANMKLNDLYVVNGEEMSGGNFNKKRECQSFKGNRFYRTIVSSGSLSTFPRNTNI